MKEYERKQLLERLDRPGSTVGASIPEKISVDGEPFELSAFVMDVKARDTIPASEESRVEDAKATLRRERLERRQRIEKEPDLAYDDGEALVEEILGIDRALNALESLEPSDLEAEARRKELADQKRWMSFLEKALGKEDGRRERGQP